LRGIHIAKGDIITSPSIIKDSMVVNKAMLDKVTTTNFKLDTIIAREINETNSFHVKRGLNVGINHWDNIATHIEIIII
jgi:hypothetical protein